MYQSVVKRIFDISLIILFAPVFVPLTVFLYFFVWFTIEKPVLFKQMRPGLNGKPFKIYKFCTMSNLRDESGILLPDEKRVTKIGRFLRRTSLDEIPELFNVLRGDMSLVGPRPLLMEYLDRYTPEQARRHQVKPGITGWAQVNGRNAITWDEKFKYDVWYVDNYSFYLDIKIILLTVLKVFKQEGVSPPDSIFMPKFQGQGYENDKCK